jgi:phage-related protein
MTIATSTIAKKSTNASTKRIVKPAAKKAKPTSRPLTAVKKAAALDKATRKVTAQGRKGAAAALRMTRDASFRLIDSQRALWLACLDALAKANSTTEVKGEQMFEVLGKAVDTLQLQAHQAIETGTEQLKSGIESATNVLDQGIGRIGLAIDALVEQTLEFLGFPKGNALQGMLDRLSELSKSMQARIRSTVSA